MPTRRLPGHLATPHAAMVARSARPHPAAAELRSGHSRRGGLPSVLAESGDRSVPDTRRLSRFRPHHLFAASCLLRSGRENHPNGASSFQNKDDDEQFIRQLRDLPAAQRAASRWAPLLRRPSGRFLNLLKPTRLHRGCAPRLARRPTTRPGLSTIHRNLCCTHFARACRSPPASSYLWIPRRRLNLIPGYPAPPIENGHELYVGHVDVGNIVNDHGHVIDGYCCSCFRDKQLHVRDGYVFDGHGHWRLQSFGKAPLLPLMSLSQVQLWNIF